MKIILVTLNSKYIHMSLAPWYLKKALDTYSTDSIETYIYEATINNKYDDVYSQLVDLKGDIYCFSMYIWNKDMMLMLINSIKLSLPNIKIVVGGPEASYQIDLMAKYKSIDYLLKGEGEESLPELVNSISYSNMLNNISGLVYRSDDQLVVNEIKPLKQYLNPYTDDFMQAIKGRIVYLETTRGCPYHCAFCLSGTNDPLRNFCVDEAKANIVKLSNSSTKTIKFVDRTFNADIKRSNELLKFIIDNPSGQINQDVCFHFEIAGDILSDEFFDIIARSKKGLVQFEIGLQSFNEETLIACHRKTDMNKLIRNIERLISINKAHIHIDLIAGLPYEGYISFKESFNKAFKLKPHMLQLGFLKLIYGSYLRLHHNDYDMVFNSDTPYTIISNRWLSQEDIFKLNQVEHSLDKLYNSGRFSLTIEYLINNMNISPFDLFYLVGSSIDSNIIHLDDYTNALYALFKDIVNDIELRDILVIDSLVSHASGRLPKGLKIEFKELKRYRLALNKIHKETKNIKRAVEYLPSKNQIVYVDYINEDPISNRYSINYININDLDINKV